MGYEIRQNAPRNMIKERRKKKANKSTGKRLSDADYRQIALRDSGLTKVDAKARAAELDAQITELDKDIKSMNRQLAHHENEMKTTKSELQRLKTAKRQEVDIHKKVCLEKRINDAFKTMDSQRTAVHQFRLKVLPMRGEIKGLRQQKYDHDRYDPAKQASTQEDFDPSAIPTFTSTPSLSRPGCLDSIDSVNIDKLEKDIDDNNRDSSNRKIVLVPGGTDPGACVLFNTVPLPAISLIKLQNRFEMLSSDDNEQEEEAQSIDDIRFPEPFQVTVQQIRHHSGLTKQARVRKKRILSNSAVRKAHRDLADNSIRRADTPQAIDKAQRVRRDSRTTLRSFEASNKMKNARRNTELQLRRTYDQVAAEERKTFKRIVHGKSSISVINMLVAAGGLSTYSFAFVCNKLNR